MDSESREHGSDSDSEQKKKKHTSSKSKKSRSQKESRDASQKEASDFTSTKRMPDNHSKRDAMANDTGVILWDLLIQQVEEKSKSNENSMTVEKSIIFVGSKSAGKTTIISRFVNADDTKIKPTIALEYTYGRKPKSTGSEKAVAHFWELGGGTWLSKLANITINPDIIKTMCVALVLDLSKPNELWVTLEKWLQVIQSRIEIVLNEISDTNVTIKEHLKRDAWMRVGEDHADQELIDPFLLPLVIIGTKYDIFQDFDPEKRKVICKTLRFVAHKYGAHLLFFSSKIESQMGKIKMMLNHLVFGGPLTKSAQTEHGKPLLITAGQDNFQQIGSPPLPEGDIGRVTAKTPWDLWKHAYLHYFPQESFADPALAPDPAKDKQFVEKIVDDMRTKKDEELEYYRKQSKRQANALFNY